MPTPTVVRTLDPQQWEALRDLEDKCRNGDLSVALVMPDIAEGIQLLLSECKRLELLADQKYLEGFNKGYDYGYHQGTIDHDDAVDPDVN